MLLNAPFNTDELELTHKGLQLIGIDLASEPDRSAEVEVLDGRVISARDLPAPQPAKG